MRARRLMPTVVGATSNRHGDSNMPAATRRQLPAHPPDLGEGYELRSETWGDISVDFDTFPPHDLAPLLKGLPDDRCQCPHWGFLFRGRVVVRYADHEEHIEAGQAYYMAPGHAPEALEDCEILQFSPAAELRRTLEVMGRNMATMGAPR